MKLLLSLINKLYGSKAIQKTIGTRTNVITLPNKQTKQLLNEQLNLGQASDQQVLKLKEDIEKLIPDIPKMNDSEVLNLTSNLQKIDNRLNPPQAEIIEMGTKQPVSPAGIKQLEAERGLPESVDPNSPLGKIMQRVKKAELESKSIAEEFGMENVLKKGLDDLMRTQQGYPSIQREGMVRTAVREIMNKDLKSGKLKIKDPEVKTNLEKYISSGEDPIETFRKYYGEDRLADIDDVADELLPAQSYTEIQDILKQKKLYDLPVKKKGAGEYDPAIKEGEKITKDIQEGKIKPMNVEPEEFAIGGRVGFSIGGSYKGGLKVLQILKKEGTTLKKQIKETMDDFFQRSGDSKYDADALTDAFFEKLDVDIDSVDLKDKLDVYDKFYKELTSKPKPSMYEQAAKRDLDEMGLSDEDIYAKYKDKQDVITEDLLKKIVVDDDPQRRAEVIATLDEALTMIDKGMESGQILDILKNMKRTKNANGGRIGFSDGGNEALLEQLYEKFLDLGLSPKEAADAARKEFEQRARKAGGGIAYLMGL